MAWLEHYNIRTTDLAATTRFYEDVIGLKTGPYPGAPGQGVWLYDERDIPVVHVISLDPDRREQAIAEIGRRLGELTPPVEIARMSGSAAIDHIAFRCDGYAAMIGRIEAHGLKYKTNDVPGFNLRQLFVNDPSGVTLELNFTRDAEPAG